MQASIVVTIFLISLQTVYCTETKTSYEWILQHEFSSANAYYWNKTMLQVAVVKRALHINAIEPSLQELVRCEIPNKTGSKWPFDSDYSILSLENGKVLVMQDETFDIVNVTSCTIDVAFDHTCKIFVPKTDHFDCFLVEQLDEATLSFDRYDHDGKLLGHFKIKRILDLDEKSIVSEIHKSEDSSSKISYYSWEPKGTEDDLLSMDNPASVSNVKILDKDYGLISEKSLEYRMHSAYSFAHDNLTVCGQWFNLSRIIDTSKLDKKDQEYLGFTECKIYDSNLNLRSTVKMNLPMETHNEWAHIFSRGYLKVHNLLGGGAVIIFQVSTDEVFYRVIDSNGKANEDNQVFYKYEKHEFNLDEEFNFCKMYLFEKNAKDRVYCGIFGIWKKFSAKCMEF